MKSKPPSKRCRTDQNHIANGNGHVGSLDSAGLKREKDGPTASTSSSACSTIEDIKSSMAATASEIFAAAKKFIISSKTMTATPSPPTMTMTSTTLSNSNSASALLTKSLPSVTTDTSSVNNSTNSLLNTVLPFPHFTLSDLNNLKDFPRLSHFNNYLQNNHQQTIQIKNQQLIPQPKLSPSHRQHHHLSNHPNNACSNSVLAPVLAGTSASTSIPAGSPGKSKEREKSEKDPHSVAATSLSSCPITLEDVDGVQTELETLWSHLSVRIRSLEKEHLTLFGVPCSPKSAEPEKHLLESSASLSSRSPVVHSHGTRTNTSNSPGKLLMLSSSVCATAASPVRLTKSPSPSIAMHRKASTASTAASTCCSPCSSLSPGGGSGIPSAAVGLLPSSSLKFQKLPKKKLKGDKASKSQRRSTKPATRTGQNRSHSMAQDGGSSSAYRQAAPNQFWDYTDSYCRDITYSDFDILERTVEEHESLPSSVFDIPPLGQHFKNNGPSSPTLRCRDRIETRSQDTVGPLTERLVSALVDRSIANYIHHRNTVAETGAVNSSSGSHAGTSGVAGSSRTVSSTSTFDPDRLDMSSVNGNSLLDVHCDGMFLDRPGLLSAVGLITCDPTAVNPHNSQPLEARVRKVLLEEGLLNSDEMEMEGVQRQRRSRSRSQSGTGSSDTSSDTLLALEDPKDEILQDIKHTHEHLRALHEYNSEKLRTLHLYAKRELNRMEGKRELEKADKELMEAYRVITSSRVKKKPLSRREREVATRALENRRSALCKLNANFGPATCVASPGTSADSRATVTKTTTRRSSSSASTSSSTSLSSPKRKGSKFYRCNSNDHVSQQKLMDDQPGGATSDDGSSESSRNSNSASSSTVQLEYSETNNHTHTKKDAPINLSS